jgi:hypothetical protein
MFSKHWRQLKSPNPLRLKCDSNTSLRRPVYTFIHQMVPDLLKRDKPIPVAINFKSWSTTRDHLNKKCFSDLNYVARFYWSKDNHMMDHMGPSHKGSRGGGIRCGPGTSQAPWPHCVPCAGASLRRVPGGARGHEPRGAGGHAPGGSWGPGAWARGCAAALASHHVGWE